MSEERQITRAERRDELRELSFERQGGELMVPKDGAQLMDMARMMSKSGLMVRDFYRDNEGACAALIMLCAPYGMNPFQVSWKTYRASKDGNAPISFEAQLVNAMVNVSAPVKGRLRYEYDGEGATRRCTVTGTDRETGADITYTTPPIGQIPTKNSPLWKSDPDQQLGYYAARAWARRHFPELLLGVYARDEIEEARDVTPRGRESPLAERVRQAQEAAQEAQDAEVIPPSDDGPDPDMPPPEEYDGGFPGSDEFDQGKNAGKDGVPWSECPYEEPGPKRVDWMAGWKDAQG